MTAAAVTCHGWHAQLLGCIRCMAGLRLLLMGARCEPHAVAGCQSAAIVNSCALVAQCMTFKFVQYTGLRGVMGMVVAGQSSAARMSCKLPSLLVELLLA